MPPKGRHLSKHIELLQSGERESSSISSVTRASGVGARDKFYNIMLTTRHKVLHEAAHQPLTVGLLFVTISY